MAEFKISLSDLEAKGLTLKVGERHTVTVTPAQGFRLLVESAYFDTDSSLFQPLVPKARSGPGVTAPIQFDNDAFWNSIARAHKDFVASARRGEFVAEGDAGDARSEEPGLDVILAALKFSDANSDHGIVVAGHTDRAGSEAHNEELSDARARCIAALIEGDRDGFVQAISAHDTGEADGNVLRFAARVRGFNCEPANPKQPSAAAIKAFQRDFNAQLGGSIAQDGVVGDETRGAYFELFDAELARLAGGTDKLATLRGKAQFADASHKTVACGERFPVDNPEADGASNQANRRVEILFFPPGQAPDLSDDQAADRIYGKGNFALARVDPETLTSDAAADEGFDTATLALQDAPAPEDGAGDMLGALTTEMAKLQDTEDPSDQYAFLDPFDSSAPDFGRQASNDPPTALDIAVA